MGNAFFKRKETRIILLGLDAAGKTTILYKLKIGDLISTIPTIGFNLEVVKYKKSQLTIWDVGGQDRIRPLWQHYFENTNAVIFVIDSSDRERVEEARLELYNLIKAPALKDAVLLVLANKQDIDGSMTPQEVKEGLQLQHLSSHTWYVQAASAKSGDGLYEGLDWMYNHVRKKNKH